MGSEESQHPVSDTLLPDVITARVGQVCGDGWHLTDVLGVGGEAAVYRAERDGGDVAAVKVLHPAKAEDADAVARFAEEVGWMRTIDHPGVVAVYEEGITLDGEPFYAMEELTGSSLEALLAERNGDGLPMHETLLIVVSVLDVLAACHDVGMVHRDVKPANVFVTEHGDVKLLDFGLAFEVDDPGEEVEGARLGTPNYMAPEQAMNATRGVSPRSDVFAVGATLYRALSGTLPREGRSMDETFVLAATTPIRSLARTAPELPIPLIRMVDRAMAMDPADRFEDARAFIAAIHEFDPATAGALDAEARRDSLRAALGALREAAAVDREAIELRRRALRDLFRALQRQIATLRRDGWETEESDRRFELLRVAIDETFETFGGALRFEVRPHSFTYDGTPVWEPEPPLDEVPYNLFQSGFRSFVIGARVPDGELTALINLMLLDPLGDMTDEDDLGTVFLESELRHIEAGLLTSFDPEMLDQLHEVDEELARVRGEVDAALEAEREQDLAELAREVGTAGVVEAEAMNLEIEREAKARGHVWGDLDPMERAALAGSLEAEPGPELTSTAMLADALSDAIRAGDESLVLEPLRELFDAWTFANRATELVATLTALRRVLDAESADRIVGEVVSERAVATILERAERDSLDEVLLVDHPDFEPLMAALAPVRFAPMLASWARRPDGPRAELLEPLLGAFASGHEAEIGEVLLTCSTQAAGPLLDILSVLNTPAAREARARAEDHPSADVRLSVLRRRLEDREKVEPNRVRGLLRSPDERIRLTTLELLRMSPQGDLSRPVLEIVDQDAFHEFALAERQQFIVTLYRLDPRLGEQVCLELLRPKTLLADGSDASTRVLAAEMLGDLSESDEAIEALDQEAKRRLRNARPLRDAAASAAGRIRARLEGGA